MRVAVKHKSERFGSDQVFQKTIVVAVSEAKVLAGDFEMAERLVEFCADFFDGTTDAVAVEVAVAEDEMGVRGKETDGVNVFDVAAVDDEVDLVLGDEGKRPLDRGGAAVSVGEDSDFHEGQRLACSS